MSKRRYIGEVAIKKENAGFVGIKCKIQIPDVAENHEHDYCVLDCDDPECREWATVWLLNKKGHAEASAYHVSECQLEDEDSGTL